MYPLRLTTDYQTKILLLLGLLLLVLLLLLLLLPTTTFIAVWGSDIVKEIVCSSWCQSNQIGSICFNRSSWHDADSKRAQLLRG